MGCVPRDTTGGGLGAPQTQRGQTSEPANSSPDLPPKIGDSGACQLSPAGTPHSWPDSGGTGRCREGNLCGFARYLRPRIPPFAHTAWGAKGSELKTWVNCTRARRSTERTEAWPCVLLGRNQSQPTVPGAHLGAGFCVAVLSLNVPRPGKWLGVPVVQQGTLRPEILGSPHTTSKCRRQNHSCLWPQAHGLLADSSPHGERGRRGGQNAPSPRRGGPYPAERRRRGREPRQAFQPAAARSPGCPPGPAPDTCAPSTRLVTQSPATKSDKDLGQGQVAPDQERPKHDQQGRHMPQKVPGALASCRDWIPGRLVLFLTCGQCSQDLLSDLP